MSVFSSGLFLGLIIGFVLGVVGAGLGMDGVIKAGAFENKGQAYRITPMNLSEVRK